MSSKSDYNPSAVGVRGSVFGLPFSKSEASIIILPVPWDATVSYAAGAFEGPDAILNASAQLDLEVVGAEPPWKKGIWMAPIDEEVLSLSKQHRTRVEPYIACLESGETHPDEKQIVSEVDQATTHLKNLVKKQSAEYLSQGKLVGLVGGDHSCPLGYIEALSEIHDGFGILQIDAHMDLRKAYEGFKHSHASIMYNALQLPSINRIVQVGIRDFCEEEVSLVKADQRIEVFYDSELKKALFEGKSWKSLCDRIIGALPEKVYISFDIDGLNPSLCPGTGTPVPGGLEYAEAVYLIQAVKTSGREIIGFDLCEVAPQPEDKEWNANVGARVLYTLCGAF